MIEKIRNKMKEAKGFTLVELIVVLVILAILAAMLVPALTGYIDKANKEKITAECRQVVMAAQTVASEKYAAGAKIVDDAGITTAASAEILTLAELTDKGTISGVTQNDKGEVLTLTWTNTASGNACNYTKNPAAGAENYTIPSGS